MSDDTLPDKSNAAAVSPHSDGPAPDLLRTLQGHGLFQNLDQDAVQSLETELGLVSLPVGQWLFRQDDPADSMYVLDSGRVEVILRTEAGDDIIVDKLERGGVIGEMALLRRAAPRSWGAGHRRLPLHPFLQGQLRALLYLARSGQATDRRPRHAALSQRPDRRYPAQLIR